MDIQPLTLSGTKVELVPLSVEHIDGIYEAGRYPEIWTLTAGAIATLDDAKADVRKALSQPAALPFVIIDKTTGRIVGSTKLFDISIANKGLEIGSTWLTPSVWRTSINTECKYLLLKHCFETLGTIRVQLKTDSRNTRSQQAIERLGAVKEGVLRNHMIYPNGYVRDSVYYSILDREWPVIKERLHSLLNPQ
ncbi:GNAT family N-acetyltransferase [Paenibacillus lignilyticus]|uniref:GNAT family N-acetyltransferase n=1 Tax=Paenibacillus lignilyticus TaxID=1172615 RepID=A0ABS5CI90_9BACL|nr:GNAT family protein [Paenibacillus lignilyticus]MBP3965566.1 GNAT family N-acetyltransferase [Paenibacillus lignilyticus]